MSNFLNERFGYGAYKKGKSPFGKAHRLARANYIPRILGFSISFLVLTFLGVEREWAYWNYIPLALYFLVYPHLVYLASKLNPDKKNIELWAMQIDAFILGIWTTYIHFFLWMSYAFLSAVVLNSIMVGGLRKLMKGLLRYALGLLIGGVLMGFEYNPEAPFYVELLAMTSLLLYMIIVGLVFYKQTRYLAEIRVELEEKNETLNEIVEELEATRDELVQKAHIAGMADLATGVLHNVGNILNSINISTTIINDTLEKSRVPKLRQANELLSQHIDHFEKFLSNDPRGKKLLNYYLKLDEPLNNEYETLVSQSKRLSQKVSLIIEVIDAQQDYARVGRVEEEVGLEKMVEDTLKLQAGSIERHSLDIHTDYGDTDKVTIQKSKLIHILINLFKNAKEAMEGLAPGNKKIVLQTYQDERNVYLSVKDNGEGIRAKDQQKVFNHGFTTKEEGHGFGLHTCANYMKEMGGEIEVESAGKGKGTTFILSFAKASP